jgi:hypothetical protein
LVTALPINGVLYIRRFYCQETGRTVSLLPDFLLPRKHYTNAFVEAVLKDLLTQCNGLCAVAEKYALDYQVLQKWLRGLASQRETKAICFSRHGPLDALAGVPDRDYARLFWNMLIKAFGGAPGGVLAAAGGLLFAEYGCSLF